MGKHLGQISPDAQQQRLIQGQKTFYLLNPSGDLANTETTFGPWLDDMEKCAGWKGIRGRIPSETEMVDALSDYDLVL